MAMSLSYSSIAALPSPALRPLHSLLSLARSNSTLAFSALAVLVIGGVLYVVILRSVFTRHRTSALKAALGGIILVLLHSLWHPEAFTIEERFMVLLPAALNLFLTMTVLSHQPTAVTNSEQWHGDEK
jgi:hypothetical protein